MKRQNRRGRTHGQRPLTTTSGRILLLLCQGPHTVADLARELNLTDNAVRAQLERLQRQGLTQPAGARPGVRRPHVEYEVSAEARELFPKAYEPVLLALVDVLSERLPPQAREEVFVETARRVLDRHIGRVRGPSLRQRLDALMEGLNGSSLGLVVEEEGGATTLRSCSCPLAAVTAAHPETCELLAKLLGQVLGGDVRERCAKGESPQCSFRIDTAIQPAPSQ